MPELSLNSLERSALEAIGERYPSRPFRSSMLFQHLFHLFGNGSSEFSLGLSREMQAVGTIC